jgi:hypothetical protein
MSARGPGSNGGFAGPVESDLPPLDPALLAEMAALRPVRTRVPARTALILVLGAVVIALATVLRVGLRRDLPALPAGWVIAVAAAWAGGLLVVLLAATLPRRGEVLPDTGRAGRSALLVAAALLLLGLFGTVDAPGVTVVPATTWSAFAARWWHCTRLGLALALPLLLLGGLLSRRIFPVGGARIAAALGAAGGAAAGLALHFVCPVGGGLHVGLAHAGVVSLGAGLGVAALSRLLRL